MKIADVNKRVLSKEAFLDKPMSLTDYLNYVNQMYPNVVQNNIQEWIKEYQVYLEFRKDALK